MRITDWIVLMLKFLALIPLVIFVFLQARNFFNGSSVGKLRRGTVLFSISIALLLVDVIWFRWRVYHGIYVATRGHDFASIAISALVCFTSWGGFLEFLRLRK